MARFVNFYSDFNPEHPFFKIFTDTRLTIGSVFGHTPETLDVLYSGECVSTLRHDGRHFTWEAHARWCTHREGGRACWFFGTPAIDHPKALWVPLYFLYWEFYMKHPDKIEARTARDKKEFGISFIVSNAIHGNLAKRRIEMAEALSKWFPVHAPEKLQPHFPAGTKVHFHDIPNKLAFAARYQFSLCFENHALPGYLTEKLSDALWVGAVPLYEGDSRAGEWFREGSFIDCAGLGAEEIAQKIESERDGSMAELVDSEREKLSLVTYPEMLSRVTAFAKAVAADRDRLLHRGRKWIRQAVGI